jgi:hypothetical protein
MKTLQQAEVKSPAKRSTGLNSSDRVATFYALAVSLKQAIWRPVLQNVFTEQKGGNTSGLTFYTLETKLEVTKYKKVRFIIITLPVPTLEYTFGSDLRNSVLVIIQALYASNRVGCVEITTPAFLLFRRYRYVTSA